MCAVPSILLVNLASNEKHHLNASEHTIGRNWLKCDDKRISRNHGILKILSNNSIKMISAHQNPMFFRKKNDPKIHQIEKGKEENLYVGDSFGLLVDQFWFSIESPGADGDVINGKAMHTNDVQLVESTTNGVKRRTSCDSEPDSTNKKVKTERNEFQADDSESANETTVLTNGDGDSMSNQTASNNEVGHEMPSTSNACINSPSSVRGPLHQPIKLEPVDSDENEAQSMPTYAIKTEPDNDNEYIDSTNMIIKTEIKKEPIKEEPTENNAVASSSGTGEVAEVAAPTTQVTVPATPAAPLTQVAQRDCCRYGIRCYRRNPLHRAQEAHPGDVDYRLPDYGDPPLGAPPCPFLDRCYRRNPMHFQLFSHKTNLRTEQSKQKDGYEATANAPKRTNTVNYAPQHDDEDSEEDPFACDGDSDADYQDPGSPKSKSDDADVFDADTDDEDNQ